MTTNYQYSETRYLFTFKHHAFIFLAALAALLLLHFTTRNEVIACLTALFIWAGSDFIGMAYAKSKGRTPTGRYNPIGYEIMLRYKVMPMKAFYITMLAYAALFVLYGVVFF